MNTRSRLWILSLIAATPCATPHVWAQTPSPSTSNLTVSVRDNYGVLPGTQVRIAPKNGQISLRAVTDRTGLARFSSIERGEYSIAANLEGFAEAQKSGVTVEAPDERVDLVMTLARFSTSVTVTTANRREELLLDTAEPTSVIDQTQILETGARSAKDLLSEQAGSGVQVNAGGGQGHVSLNGIPNSGVLILIDGRRYLGRDANGNFNLEDLPMTGIERVEVVKGAGSALYGSDAMGGVINFISSKSKDQGLKNRLSLTGGTLRDLRGEDTASYRGSRGGFAASSGYRTFDGFDLEPVPSRPNPQTIGQPESQWKTFTGNGDYRLSGKVAVNFVSDYSKRDIDKYFFSGPTQILSSVYNSRRNLERFALTPEAEITPDRSTAINLSYTHGRYNRDETRLYDNRPTNPVEVQPRWSETNDEFKTRLLRVFRFANRENPFQFGVERRNEELSRGGLVGCAAGRACLKSRNLDVVWAQQEVNLRKDLKVTAGLRYDKSSDYGSETSPKVGAVFSLAEGHRLRGSYGQGFRAPYFGELFLVAPGFQGNPALKPERSQTTTAGWAYLGARIETSVDLFNAKVEDGVVFSQLSPILFTYDNVRKFDSKGANASVAINLKGGFTPSVSYTYIKRDDDQNREIGGFPTHAAFVKLLWSNARLGLRANIRGNLNGKTPTALGSTSYTPKYSVWYTQASKRLTLGSRQSFTLFAQVNNILDEKNVFNLDAQGMPRTNELLPVWLAPRTYLIGITFDSDWTR